jgi:hypothetical protein
MLELTEQQPYYRSGAIRIKTDVRHIINSMSENQAKQLAITMALRWRHSEECAIYKEDDTECTCGSDSSLARCVEDVLATES